MTDNVQRARDMVAAARQRQFEHGFDAAHDDVYVNGELASAATCYYQPADVMTNWPASWDRRRWKPSGDRMHDLAKAGALMMAEIARCERVEASGQPWTPIGGRDLPSYLTKLRWNLGVLTSGMAWMLDDRDTAAKKGA